MDPIKVYVVEDSAVIRDAMIERLEERGMFQVVGVAETAQEAIRGVRQTHPDVLVLDLHLKQGTGFDVLKSLQGTPEPTLTQIVMMTSLATPVHQNHALKLGATQFYDKAMQFDEMLDALHRWADRSNLH